MTRLPKTYRPPSKRRLQVEAWGVVLTLVIVSWSFVGGIYMAVQLIRALLNL